MGLGMNEPIPAPISRPPAGGLLASANRPTDVPDVWAGGFGYEPEACVPGELFAIGCGTSSEKGTAGRPGVVTYQPAVIVYGDSCSTMSRSAGDVRGRADRGLAAWTSEALERLLWTGEAEGDADPEVRPHLADGNADVVTAGTLGLATGWGNIDQALTTCLGGAQGMLHVTPLLLAHLVAGDLVVRDTNRWLSPNGHVVVAGAGYTGGASRPTPADPLPAAPDLAAATPAAQSVYGTGLVSVLLGPTASEIATDRSINSTIALTERAAATYWGCCQLTVSVQPPDDTPA